ncbi:MAG: hypothetical protein NZ927_09640 [Candidatus Calescibacterium sp.]|nr:hypothetical protein [Candidatus Calescibacterium sp.]MDW8088067.1 Dickkopf N-terminal cysteine-rich domain-containing protein [Candidatus Calescibacterium sp.]
MIRRLRNYLLFLKVWLILFLIFSCSDKKSEQDTVNIDNLCQKYYEIYLKVYQKIYYECFVSFVQIGVGSGDISGLIQSASDRSREICEARISELKKAVGRKSVDFNKQKAQEYLKNLENLLAKSCEEISRNSVRIEIGENLREILGRTVFSGKLMEGQECYIQNECADGLYCGGKSCPGTCVPLGKVGDFCLGHEECQPDLVCYSNSCTSTQAVACRRSSDCPSNQKCVDGRCTIFKQKGEYCERSEECDYTCDFQTKKCIEYKFAEYGKPCGSINGDLVECKKGVCVIKETQSICEPYGKENESCVAKRCDIGFVCSDQFVCKKISKEGERCDTGICGYGLYCKDGICQKKKEVGEVCITPQECKTENCSEGRCFDPRQNVKACDEDSDCISWNCLNNNCCSSQ